MSQLSGCLPPNGVRSRSEAVMGDFRARSPDKSLEGVPYQLSLRPTSGPVTRVTGDDLGQGC